MNRASSVPNSLFSLPLESISMASTPTKEVESEILGAIRIYKDGTIERLLGSPFVPPSLQDSITNVSSKDIKLSPQFSARLYLPQITNTVAARQNLPILLYFHGGAFCFESAFSADYHTYMNSVVSESGAVAVSVEYRRVPEHVCRRHMMTAGMLCSGWLHTLFLGKIWKQSLGSLILGILIVFTLVVIAQVKKVLCPCVNVGANMVHNIAMRAGREHLKNDVKIKGAFLAQPLFMGSKQLPKEIRNPNDAHNPGHILWMVAYPSAPDGIDNVMINPLAANAPSLTGLGCERLLVCVAEKDKLRERGIAYYEGVKKSGWKGEIEVFEGLGEEHCYHIISPGTLGTKNLIKVLASFVLV